MQVRADASLARQNADKRSANFGRFQAAETDAEVAGQATEHLEEVPEPAPVGLGPAPAQVDAIVAQMNAGQDDLLIAASRQAAHFLDDVFQGPAAKSRPDLRDNAVIAVEQAAVLHFHKGALVAVKAVDATRQLADSERLQLFAQLRFVGDDLD